MAIMPTSSVSKKFASSRSDLSLDKFCSGLGVSRFEDASFFYGDNSQGVL